MIIIDEKTGFSLLCQYSKQIGIHHLFCVQYHQYTNIEKNIDNSRSERYMDQYMDNKRLVNTIYNIINIWG